MMTELEIKKALQTVKDPEIPTVSLLDLGVIDTLSWDGEFIEIEMIPTFAACPAIELMRLEVIEALKQLGIAEEKIKVWINRNKSWSSNKLTPQAIEGLKQFGLSPPQPVKDWAHIPSEPATCPKCGSENTQMISPFGPTLCRVVHKCLDCLETFEQFKSV